MSEIGRHFPHTCDSMRAAIETAAVHYDDATREHGVVVPDGGSSFLVICYCPFCGQRLPESLADRRLFEIRKPGLDFGDDLPPDLQSDDWWRKA